MKLSVLAAPALIALLVGAGLKPPSTHERSAPSVERADMLRAAEAFVQLGDRDEVELSLHIARDLAGSDPESVADLKAATARLSDLLEAPQSEARVDD
jgi:hypothetical protein